MGKTRLNGLFAFVVAAVVLGPGIVRADPLASLQDAQERLLRSAQAGKANAAAPAAATPALSQFTANGAVAVADSDGGCETSAILSGCSSSDCLQLQVSGPLAASSPVGKSTVAACLTLYLPSGTGLCYDEQGNGTITATNGATLRFATGGKMCFSDAGSSFDLYITEGGVTFEGGTGAFASAVGEGHLSFPLIITSSGTATGEFNMIGNLAK